MPRPEKTGMKLSRRAWREDLGGVECLSGIPGLAGGTPVQNVGAYGQEIADVLVSVRALDRQTESVVELSNRTADFPTARASSIQRTGNATLSSRSHINFVRKLCREVKYPDLLRRFEGRRGASDTAGGS